MNHKCNLCQQINNLTTIYDTDLKYFAEIILKLKGYKDTLDIEEYFAICEKCHQGLQIFAEFWENIPEAGEQEEERQDQTEIQETLPKESKEPKCPKQQEADYEPIKIRIKLPQKTKKPKTRGDNLILNNEILNTKRLRHPPKRYEDFKTNAINQLQPQRNSSNLSFEEFPVIALLRFPNGLEVGKLIEVESKDNCSRVRIICLKCPQTFRFEKEFENHIKTHVLITSNETFLEEEKYLYYCKLCDKSFREHYAVRRHYRIAHSEERPLKCEYCEASFKYKFNLDYHMAKHIPKKPFECDFCKKSFVLRYELKIHLRTHTKEKPYTCQFCTMAFAHLTNLKTHKKVKHFKDSTISNNSQGKEIKQNETITDNTKENYPEEKEANTSEIINLGLNESVDKKAVFPKANIELNIPMDFENVSNNLNYHELSESKTTDTSSTVPKVSETVQNNAVDTELISNALERFNNSAHFGTFHLDTSILKVLPSSELLGLKKWSKSYQNVSYAKYNSGDGKYEGVTQNQEAGNTSVIKYKPIEKNSKSKHIENTNNSSISTSFSSNKDSSRDQKDKSQNTENKQITNFEVPSGSTLMKGGRFINISKLSSSSTFKDLDNFKGIKIVDNKSKAKEEKANLNSPGDKSSEVSKVPNNSQSWKVIKVSSRPVKIINLNKSKINLNSTKITSPKTETFTTNSSSAKMDSPLNKSDAKQPGQSLLKPELKTQQPTSLTLTKSLKNETNLCNKPLITNIEILPPLSAFAPTTLTSTPQQNLIKPPANYKYQCPYCWKYFKQKSPLTKHLRTHTGEKPYKCNLCPKSYADASNYKKHKILHKNAAEALNIKNSSNSYAVPNSPAYSTVSDPDPDGLEVMQTIKKFEDDMDDDGEMDEIDDDNDSLSSATMESYMWQDALEHALMNEDIRENIKRNLAELNNAIMPKSMQQLGGKGTMNNFSTEDPD